MHAHAQTCVQVFKALADGEEESVQPKKPKAEAPPRTPYVPKQARVSGQKRQGKGKQQGPQGKKQKKNGPAEAAAEADAEEAPPLPPPDSLSAYDSSQTMVEGNMEGDDSMPVPPLPPPSPDSPHAPPAVDNGDSALKQSASGPLAPALEPGSTHSTILPLEAPSAPQGRTQVGFKLQMSKRQKLKMTEAEEPITHGMRERLERHLALQQQQLQQQQQQQPQQQLSQQVPQLQQGMQLQGRHELQAPGGSLPLPGPPPGPVLTAPGAHHLPYAAMPHAGLRHAVHAADHSPVSGLPSNVHHSRHAQSQSEVEEQQQQQHASHRQHKRSRHDAADESAPLVPGLETDLHQSPQQLPQQLLQAEHELPPGLAPEQDQSSHQSPQQLQRRLSHRHVHHRRRHSHRTDRTDQDPSQQHAEPAPLSDDIIPDSQPEPQQSVYGSGALLEQPTVHLDVDHATGSAPLPSQDARPAYQLLAHVPNHHQGELESGAQNGLGGLAESGGPVAVASEYDGAQAEVQVLADDVKSLLR